MCRFSSKCKYVFQNREEHERCNKHHHHHGEDWCYKSNYEEEECCDLRGKRGHRGHRGHHGHRGHRGHTGSTGASGVVGTAEYIRTIQSPNNSVPPGTAFTIDTEVINTVPTDIVASAGTGGTVFTLTAGTYIFDYEMSLAAAGSVALYVGPSSGSLAIDNNTIAGSSTGTTWIHGRSIETVATTLVVAVSSVVGTANVVSAGTAAGHYMIRLTILKVA